MLSEAVIALYSLAQRQKQAQPKGQQAQPKRQQEEPMAFKSTSEEKKEL